MQLWRFPPAHTISAKPRPASWARPNPKQRALITSYRPPLPAFIHPPKPAHKSIYNRYSGGFLSMLGYVNYTYPSNLTGCLVSDLRLQHLKQKLVPCFCSFIGCKSAAVSLVMYEEIWWQCWPCLYCLWIWSEGCCNSSALPNSWPHKNNWMAFFFIILIFIFYCSCLCAEKK